MTQLIFRRFYIIIITTPLSTVCQATMADSDNKLHKVFITSTNQVTFTCPKCEHPRIINLCDHEGLEKATTVKVRCKECGHIYRAVLEKRQQYRKLVNLPGTYIQLKNGQPIDKGEMVVRDISRRGLKLRVFQQAAFALGDKLIVKFRLDDANQSPISKEVQIRKFFYDGIGVEFTSVHASDPSDRALGFYMFG
jgi:hypothetical protein